MSSSRTGHQTPALTALVTGFEPFGGASVNPSWEAVRLLPPRLGLAPRGDGAEHGPVVNLGTHLLPVTFDGAATQVRRLIAQHRPDIVVHVGLNERAPAIMLETRAYNEQTARIPDNAGHQPRERAIVPGGALVRYSTWAAPVLAGRLQAAGLPAQVSDDAGRYVCNTTLYTALDTIGSGQYRPTGFVHVPRPETVPTAQVVSALTALLGELAGQVLRHRLRGVSGRRPGEVSLAEAIALARTLGAGRERVLRVGLTGGIGAGKSTVARMLAARGAQVVDADVLAREVVAPGQDALEAIVRAFGRQVLAADGSLDRGALAQAVFSPQAAAGARQRLDAIVLPRIAAEAARRMDADRPGQGQGSGAVSVYDVPLLVEGGMADLLDAVVVVEAPLATRLARLEERGLGREQAVDRMRHQATDAQRREVTDVVVPNDGDEAELAAAVDRLWSLLVGMAHD